MNCKSCNNEVYQNYCPNCGQPSKLKRIDGHYIAHEIEHVLHFERGILYTIKELITNPGDNVRHYISENRARLVKPIIFIIITSLLYTIVNGFFHIEEGYLKYDGISTTTTGRIFSWVQSHYGYANIIMGVFTAFWVKIFFKKYDYNFFEILILLCFVTGIEMLIYAFFACLYGLIKIDLMQFGGMIGIAYCSWAIGHFFDKKKTINYLKGFAAFVLGIITSVTIALTIGTIIDLLIKH